MLFFWCVEKFVSRSIAMSTFWDSIKASTVQYPAKVDTLTLENVWDNIPAESGRVS